MPDREKVIKGLEHCSFGENRGCAGCPYNDECGDWGRDAGVGSLCTDALALLREQEPVKPKEIILNVGDGSDPFIFGWECGDCGGWLPFSSNNYCPKCGRKVKWGEGN